MKPFRDYALLGDDIVITDKSVAKEYRRLIRRLGVAISDPKSIRSDNGTLEFAKRYWSKRLQKDLSPVSLKSLMAARTPLALCALGVKYQLETTVVLRLGGAGFRARSRVVKPVSSKWKRLRDAYSKYAWNPNLPIEWWIGGGKPLSPYIHGVILEMVKETLKPRDLRVPSWFYKDDMRVELDERRLLHGWMSVWLEANRRYFILVQSGEVSLNAYFDLPMVSCDWKARFDEDRFKFGFFWKCVDKARGMAVYRDSALPEPSQYTKTHL